MTSRQSQRSSYRHRSNLSLGSDPQAHEHITSVYSTTSSRCFMAAPLVVVVVAAPVRSSEPGACAARSVVARPATVYPVPATLACPGVPQLVTSVNRRAPVQGVVCECDTCHRPPRGSGVLPRSCSRSLSRLFPRDEKWPEPAPGPGRRLALSPYVGRGAGVCATAGFACGPVRFMYGFVRFVYGFRTESYGIWVKTTPFSRTNRVAIAATRSDLQRPTGCAKKRTAGSRPACGPNPDARKEMPCPVSPPYGPRPCPPPSGSFTTPLWAASAAPACAARTAPWWARSTP